MRPNITSAVGRDTRRTSARPSHTRLGWWLGCALVLVGASPAHADAPWSSPQTVAGASSPRLAFAPAGNGLLAYTTPSGLFTSPLAPDGSLGAATAVSPASVFAIRASGRSDFLLAHGGGGTAAAGSPLRVGDQLIEPYAPGDFSLDANRSGDAALIAMRCPPTSCERGTPVLAIRRRGGNAFHRAIALAPPGRIRGVTVALDGHGDALAVWAVGGWVYDRIWLASGGLTRRQRVGPSRVGPRLAASFSGARRAVLVWGSQAVNEGFPLSPFDVYLAVMSAHRRFAKPQRLESVRASGDGTEVLGAGIALLGNSTVAWTGRDRDRFVVRSRAVSGGAVHTLSPRRQDAVLSGAAIGTGGTTVIGWTTGLHGQNHDPHVPSLLQVAVGHHPAETIGPGDFGTADAQFAVSPTGVPVVAWAPVLGGFWVAHR